MTYYLDDLDKNPHLLEELRAKSDDEKCHGCGVTLQETITGKRQFGDHDNCSDCFYGLLGDAIEANPIASAGSRRG